MRPLELITRWHDDYVTIVLRGDLDAVSAAGAATVLDEITGRPVRLVLDLAGLGFLDCCGLSVLLAARTRARAAGGDLVLAAPRRQVLRLLTLTGHSDVLATHNSAASSVACSVPPDRPTPT